MARAQRGGSAAFAWALVVFGFGFVVCLLLAIVFYTQLSDAQIAADEAQQELREYVSAAEEGSPNVLRVTSDERYKDETVVGALIEENEFLRGKLGVSATDSRDAIEARLQVINVDSSLIRAVTTLRNEVASLEKRIEGVNEKVINTESALKTAQNERDKLASQFQQARTTLENQVEQRGGTVQQLQQKLGTLETDLEQQMQQTSQTMQQRVTAMRSEIEQLEQEKIVLNRRIGELLDIVKGTAGAAGENVTSADGQIVSVISETDQAYINLGKDEHVPLGLTFEVFGKDELIKLDQYDRLRGKATIEVFEVGDGSSVARIVRTDRGATIKADDQIVNLIFDPKAEYKFYVYGDFDIDQIGDATAADRRRIESMVSRWGGKLAEDLDYDVDYIVLGEAPPIPEPLPPTIIDPVKIAENVAAQRAYERYQSIKAEAKKLSIPVLNQNRFLALTGYYQR